MISSRFGRPNEILETPRTVCRSEFCLYAVESVNGLHYSVLLGRSREGETVDENVLARNSVFKRAVEYFFCNGKASLGGFGDTALVEGESDNSRAVFLDERKDIFERLVLAVYGVYDRLAVVYAQTRFNYFRDRRVKLEGSVANALDSLDGSHHHLFFVDPRKSDIYVKDLRSCVYLLDSLRENVVNVISEESLLETLSRGVDSLADNAWLIYVNAVHGGGARARCLRFISRFLRALCPKVRQ